MNEFTDCFICGRNPLVGEEVMVFADGGRETAVCDPCLSNPRAAAMGDPVDRERIRSTEGAATVRRLIPVPVPQRISPDVPSLPVEA